MRILLSSYYFPPSIGGVERHSDLLVRGLVRRGHTVYVVSARLPGDLKEEVYEGVTVRRVSPGKGSSWQRMATYLAGMIAATVQARDRIDLIQVQQALYPAAAMALVARALRIPLVVRNSGSGQFGAVSVMRRVPLGVGCLWVIGRAATCVSLTEHMSREMRDAGFRDIVEIPNGVEVPPVITWADREEARRALGLTGPLVLYVGRLDREKGVDLLVRAWQQSPANGATLLIVGEGPERESLQRLASEPAASAATIRFCGASSNVRSYLAVADIFVLPSRSEGTSNALLEAMASGLPVVATDVGGTRAVVDRIGIGTLVPGDPAAMAGAIHRYLGDPQLCEAVGLSAREHVAERYSSDKMIDAYERLYVRILTERNPTRAHRIS